MIKSRRIRLAGHVAHMGDRRGVYKVRVHKVFGLETRRKETTWKTQAWMGR